MVSLRHSTGAAAVYTLDVAVIVADLAGRAGGVFAVVDHPADREERAQQAWPALPEKLGVFADGRAEFRVHVLHRPGPWSLQ